MTNETVSSEAIAQLVTMLAYQAPHLLLCLIGFVLGLVFLRRYPVPAILTCLATGLWILSGIGGTVAQTLLMQSMQDHMLMSMDTMGRWFSILAAVRSAISALALGLLLTAVFVGRSTSSLSAGKAAGELPTSETISKPSPAGQSPFR